MTRATPDGVLPRIREGSGLCLLTFIIQGSPHGCRPGHYAHCQGHAGGTGRAGTRCVPCVRGLGCSSPTCACCLWSLDTRVGTETSVTEAEVEREGARENSPADRKAGSPVASPSMNMKGHRWSVRGGLVSRQSESSGALFPHDQCLSLRFWFLISEATALLTLSSLPRLSFLLPGQQDRCLWICDGL